MQETGMMQEIGMPRTTRTTQFSHAHYVNDDRALVPFIRPPYLDIGSQPLMAHNPKTKQPMSREDTVKGETFADALTFVHYSPETDSHDKAGKDCHLQDYGVSTYHTAAQLTHRNANTLLKRKEAVLHDEEGNVQGSILVLGSRPNKRAALSPKKREQTALARQGGVCERCRLAKKRVSLLWMHFLIAC
jgi:carbamoylphosphate synthase large subunit